MFCPLGRTGDSTVVFDPEKGIWLNTRNTLLETETGQVHVAGNVEKIGSVWPKGVDELLQYAGVHADSSAIGIIWRGDSVTTHQHPIDLPHATSGHCSNSSAHRLLLPAERTDQM